jgi:1-acyl-sn-glycerol-3-phosphate acyltransferase
MDQPLVPEYATLGARLQRRAISVTALFLMAVVVTLSAPMWLVVVVFVDLARFRWTLPLARLLLFGWYWSIIECAGVVISFGLWLAGQSKNQRLHYRLMGWWAGKLMTGLRSMMRATIDVSDDGAFETGEAVLLCRHASLADSLLSAWVVCTRRGLYPRYVLKRELLWDPCLDIVGLRVPNYFVDRGSRQSEHELAAVGALGGDLGPTDVAVIFPEGTRSSSAKRQSAINRIREQSPERLFATEGLRHLIPVRPSGSLALVNGAPSADVVVAWHTGFDGLSTFGGVLRALVDDEVEIVFRARRIGRASIAEVGVAWLDEIWAKMDGEVDEKLRMTS